MSGPFEEARPPRRPKPKADSSEASTFRPNPNPGKKPRAASSMPIDFDIGKGPAIWERIFFGRVSSGQLAAFCRQFAAYMSAGVDIGKSLVNLRKQFAMSSLGPVIGRLSVAVKRGDSFAAAFAREPQAFAALFVGMMRVAEARGGIPETLKSLSRHYENRQSLIRQARSAMIYPLAVLLIASAVVAMMTLWLLPSSSTSWPSSRGTRARSLRRRGC